MTLPKCFASGFREIERCGCPIVIVGGLEAVALWRVVAAMGGNQKAVLKRLAEQKPTEGVTK